MRRTFLAVAAVLIAIPSLGLARARAHSAPHATDDHTVVAILELANSFDLETGQLAADHA